MIQDYRHSSIKSEYRYSFTRASSYLRHSNLNLYFGTDI